MSLAAEVHAYAVHDGDVADQSERDAMIALADRALAMKSALQEIETLDWGVICDIARSALEKAEGRQEIDEYPEPFGNETEGSPP